MSVLLYIIYHNIKLNSITGRSIKNRTAFENDIENDEKHILRYLHDMCTCIPTS